MTNERFLERGGSLEALKAEGLHTKGDDVRSILVFLIIIGCTGLGYAQVNSQDYDKLKKDYDKVSASAKTFPSR